MCGVDVGVDGVEECGGLGPLSSVYVTRCRERLAFVDAWEGTRREGGSSLLTPSSPSAMRSQGVGSGRS